MDKKLTDAIRFFADHAGYADPPGRMVCAKALALAEQEAEEWELKVTWDCEQYPDTSWMSKNEIAEVDRGSIDVLCAYIRFDGETLASLGNIAVYVDDQDYRRVVEAELKAEALLELKSRVIR